MHLKMSSTKWRQFCLGLNVSIFQNLLQLCLKAHSNGYGHEVIHVWHRSPSYLKQKLFMIEDYP